MQLPVVLPIMLIALATLAARINGQQSKLLSRVLHQKNTAARAATQSFDWKLEYLGKSLTEA